MSTETYLEHNSCFFFLFSPSHSFHIRETIRCTRLCVWFTFYNLKDHSLLAINVWILASCPCLSLTFLVKHIYVWCICISRSLWRNLDSHLFLFVFSLHAVLCSDNPEFLALHCPLCSVLDVGPACMHTCLYSVLKVLWLIILKLIATTLLGKLCGKLKHLSISWLFSCQRDQGAIWFRWRAVKYWLPQDSDYND